MALKVNTMKKWKMTLTKQQENDVKALVDQMTVQEKIGQLHQLSPNIVGGFDLPFEEVIEMLTDGRITHQEFEEMMGRAEMDYKEEDIRKGQVGSFLIKDPTKCNELQRIAVEESRLGIPLIYGFDVIHGFNTVFPIPLAEACSFDEVLFEKTARASALEAVRAGVRWTFSPMIDISRDARWGRISESPGEDPYLSSIYADSKVKGYQSDEDGIQNRIASCLKHFVGYGACEGGQDYNTVSMSNSVLHDVYLAPFRSSVAQGAATVMAAFNDMNGVPCTSHEYLLKKVLKEDYGFDGFVVSDANAIKETINHGYAADLSDAAYKALKAGMDMDMNTYAFYNHIEENLAKGLLSIDDLNDAVTRVLRVKMWLGLFDDPYITEEILAGNGTVAQSHRQLALEVAVKSAVLLKNDQDILPLKEGVKIGLVGGLADKQDEVMGAWAIAGLSDECVSIKQGLLNEGFGVAYNALVDQEFKLFDTLEDDMKALADKTDVIVAVVGETISMSGEAASRACLDLPGDQLALIKMAKKTGKPVVVILMNGRPLAIPEVVELADGIIEGWQLGTEMGTAIAGLLSGRYMPEGKLSCTFPANTGQCPKYYNHPSTGRPGGKSKFTSRYLDAPNEPLFPFGYGLSYTSFDYENLQLTDEGDTISATVTVRNTGQRAGVETVQLYIKDCVASIVRPVKELKSFKKQTLEPGEQKIVIFELEKSQLGFYDHSGYYCLEDGKFIVYVGGNSKDTISDVIDVRFGK